jgi:hypothetical protein
MRTRVQFTYDPMTRFEHFVFTAALVSLFCTVLLVVSCGKERERQPAGAAELQIDSFSYADVAGSDGVVTFVHLSRHDEPEVIINLRTNPLGERIAAGREWASEWVSITLDDRENLLRTISRDLSELEIAAVRSKQNQGIMDGWQIAMCVVHEDGQIGVIWNNESTPALKKIQDMVDKRILAKVAAVISSRPEVVHTLDPDYVVEKSRSAYCQE